MLSFGIKETTNNFFVAPQPKGRQSSASDSNSQVSLSGRKTSIFGFLGSKSGANTSTLAAKTHTIANGASSGHGTGHSHQLHAAPWEGVNLWRTPYKGDTDTVTHVKSRKSMFDQYIENRIRRIQQLQLLALRNKSTPIWIIMPRDKFILAAQGILAVYVVYQMTAIVYNHLKAKDRLKLIKLLYKDNVD